MKLLGFFAACGLGTLAVAAACSSSSPGGAPTGASCVPTDPACPALAVKSDCLALVDNTGKDQFVLRMSQLEVVSPAVLSTPLVANLVGKGVNINLPKCNVPGDGTFSLITEFDIKAGKIKTGGGLPTANPTDGYCYANDAANKVAPVEVPAKFTVGTGGVTFSTDPIAKIVMPVYQPDMKSTIHLPLSQAKLVDGQISADHNCVGSFNGTKLDPNNNCLEEPSVKFFTNGAKLEGYITLEEADAVLVPQLTETLCALLVGTDSAAVAKYIEGTAPKKCKRTDGKTIDLKGDWCSMTNAAGGCQDSFRLSASLASSAVKLKASCP
jgi:hypothetical protein